MGSAGSVRPVVRSHSWLPPGRRLWAGLAVSIAGPLLIALLALPARTHVDGAVFGLALLVPTAIGAAVGGPAAALAAVVVGSLTHNVLFTEPYMTVLVADTTDVVGLAVHSIVAVAVSLVVVREQRAAQLAAIRGEEAARVRLLEETDRTKTALLGAVSHDLRTPLSAVAAAASELRASDVTFTEAQRDVLTATIVDETERLDRMVAKLLDAGRLQSGGVRVAAEAVEPHDLIAEALSGLRDEAGRIRVHVEPGTPPALVDPQLLVAALRNLIDNALRYGPSGTPVDIGVMPAAGWVEFSVRDHGPGLDDADPTELFAPFRASSTGGTGLGLAITRGFVEAQGGQVRAANAPDGGAVFCLLVPSVAEPSP